MGEEHFRENKISQVILIFESKIVHSYNFIYLFIYLFFFKGIPLLEIIAFNAANLYKLAIFVLAIMSRGETEVKMLTDQSQDYHV